MSSIKVSDVFKNETNKFIFGSVGRDVYQYIDRNIIDIVGRFDTNEQASAAALAVNSHVKLTEENKMLREALAFCVPHAEFALQGQMFNKGMANAREVLGQTK